MFLFCSLPVKPPDAVAQMDRATALQARDESAERRRNGFTRSSSTAIGWPPGSRAVAVKLLTRSGLDWTAKYPATAAAFAKLKVRTAYIDGELCGVRPDGVTSFELMQQASTRRGGLVYFAFDLLELDGEDIARLPLLERKKRLAALLRKPPAGIAYSEHEGGDGEAFRRAACQHGLEGHRLEAARPALSARRPRRVGQDQMPQPGRVRRRGMVGPGRIAALRRRASAGLLRAGWTAGLRRPRRHGHEPEDARDAAQAPPAAGDQENASRRSPASRHPVREAAGVGQGSLGPARTGRRNHLSELAGRRPSSPHGFRRLARGQACARGPAGDATGRRSCQPGLRTIAIESASQYSPSTRKASRVDALADEADLLVERDGRRVVGPDLELDPDQTSPESVVDCGLEEPETNAAPAALGDDAHTDRAPVGEGGQGHPLDVAPTDDFTALERSEGRSVGLDLVGDEGPHGFDRKSLENRQIFALASHGIERAMKAVDEID